MAAVALMVEQQAVAQRVQEEANPIQAQADEERRKTQPEEQDFRGSDNLPTDPRVEGSTTVFDSMQAKQAERQQHFAAATTTQAGNFVSSQASIRMPAVYHDSFKVRKDPQQVMIFTSQMNAFLGQ